MGMIRIEVAGSFDREPAQAFSAEANGHAAAVAEAIRWLAGTVLPKAIANDHRCHTDGVAPSNGFAGQRIPSSAPLEARA